MKKSMFILLLLLIVIIVTIVVFIISSKRNNVDTNDVVLNTSTTNLQSNNNNNENSDLIAENVKMTIKEGTLTKNGVTVIITDENEERYYYDNWFRIDKRQNDEWIELELLNPNSTMAETPVEGRTERVTEMDIDWTYQYGELEPGEYRLVKSALDSERRFFSVEFIIE